MCVCVCVCVASQVALVEKNLPTNTGDVKRHRFNPWVGKISCRRKWTTHFSILAWRIPWTVKLWGATVHGEKEMATHSRVLAWRIPGMGSLVGCRLWGCTESDMTEAT